MSSSPSSSPLTSPDDSDIDALISQTTDLCILEQIAALNTAHLSPADLPADLESRFKTLKTLPEPNRRSDRPPHCSVDEHETVPANLTDPDPQISLSASQTPDLGPGTRSEPRRSRSRSRSPSPARAICCFGCSRRTAMNGGGRRRTAMNGGGRRGTATDGGDEIFVDFGAGKMRERRKKMERVLREQEKASREVEKMVEMMEKTAARWNREALDEILMDCGLKKFG